MAAGDPTAMSWGGQHVVYRGTKGEIHELYRLPRSTWAHADLTGHGQGPDGGERSAGYIREGSQFVVYRDSKGNITSFQGPPAARGRTLT